MGTNEWAFTVALNSPHAEKIKAVAMGGVLLVFKHSQKLYYEVSYSRLKVIIRVDIQTPILKLSLAV